MSGFRNRLIMHDLVESAVQWKILDVRFGDGTNSRVPSGERGEKTQTHRNT